METIVNYLDNMFAALPKTSRILRLKEELLATMEEKYLELKREGKSENEAIGIVISEFGNIDELMREMGIVREQNPEEEQIPAIGEPEIEAYLGFKRRFGLLVGLGVTLILAGAALLLVLAERLGGFGTVIGLIALFVSIAAAVGMFVYSGVKAEQFRYLKSDFYMPHEIRASLMRRREAFMPSYTFALTAGVVLCVLSPAALIGALAANESLAFYGAAGTLLTIAGAVFLFIYAG